MDENLEFEIELTEEDQRLLSKVFTYHRPSGNQAERYTRIRAAGKAFAAVVLGSCPNSRERSMAFSHIQEAVMCANAAIAVNENHVPEVEQQEK